MPIFSAPASKRSLGWALAGPERYGWKCFETIQPEAIAEMQDALDADIDACETCQHDLGNPVKHATSTVLSDGRGWTYQCRSGSRWWNPKKKQMEGRPHCTCDSCF